MLSEEELKKEAEKIATEKTGWIVHFASYIIVNIFMLVFWYVTTGPETFPWFIFMTIGWGIGVAVHFFAVYIDLGWKEKMKIKEYERLKKLQEKIGK